MKFAIRALSPDQVVSQLVVEAQDEAEARRQVAERGLYVSAISSEGSGLGAWWPGRSSSGAKGFSLVLFSQELLALLKAGLGIVETLEALIEKEDNPTLRAVLARLLKGLRDGKRFSTVLAEQPLLFPPLYVGVMKAAEGTSDLPRSLERFINYQERIDAVRTKVVSAAIYPAILMSVGGAVSFFLMAFVVPKFAEVYQGTGREMPWMSKMMLSWGEFVSNHTQTLLGCLAVLGVTLALLYQRFKAAGGFARLLVRLPGALAFVPDPWHAAGRRHSFDPRDGNHSRGGVRHPGATPEVGQGNDRIRHAVF
jgi:general secretion pathway protein F